MTTNYLEHNHPKSENLNISNCYLCGKPLEEPINSDHIIPDSIFPNGAVNRPQLPVHESCNAKKTKLDERFKLRIQMISQVNSPLADTDFSQFLAKVIADRKDAFLVGKSPRNYILARTLTKGAFAQTHMIKNGQHLVKIQTGQQHVDDILTYTKTMTKGLVMRNVPSAKLSKPVMRFLDPHSMSTQEWANQEAILKKSLRRSCRYRMLFYANVDWACILLWCKA